MNMHLADSIQVFWQCRLWLAFFYGESTAVTEQDIVESHFSSRDLLRWQQFRPAATQFQFLNSRRAVRAVLQKNSGTKQTELRMIPIHTDALCCCHVTKATSLTSAYHIPQTRSLW